jgi:hypothetical protein
MVGDNTGIVKVTKIFDTAQQAGDFVDRAGDSIPGMDIEQLIYRNNGIPAKWAVDIMVQGELMETWEAVD